MHCMTSPSPLPLRLPPRCIAWRRLRILVRKLIFADVRSTPYGYLHYISNIHSPNKSPYVANQMLSSNKETPLAGLAQARLARCRDPRSVPHASLLVCYSGSKASASASHRCPQRNAVRRKRQSYFGLCALIST